MRRKVPYSPEGFSFMDFGYWQGTFGPAPDYYSFEIFRAPMGYILRPCRGLASGPFDTCDDAAHAAKEIWDAIASGSPSSDVEARP